MEVARLILALNGGSSTLKSSLVGDGDGQPVASATTTWGEDRNAALDRVLADLGKSVRNVRAVAHRVVHGGQLFTRPVVIDDGVLAGIEALADLAPLHSAVALDLIHLARTRFADVPHVACFDTAFHATIPEEAWRYPVPYHWTEEWGIRRYGFHGLSVEWSVRRAAHELGGPADGFSLVVAHLGSGCSVTAVENGRSRWTSMGFTPLDGLMMGTRSGSIDPGIVLRLSRSSSLGIEDTAAALELQSGLLGVSGVSADMRAVRDAAERGNEHAALALRMFAARAAEGIAAAMTWVRPDAIVFTGGIGEHDGEMRNQILERIPTTEPAPRVLVVAAQEEVVMAQATATLVAAD